MDIQGNKVDQEVNELLTASYYGIGGFSNGLYCIPAPSESPTKYIYRTQVAKYANFVQQIVDANHIPVGNGIERSFEGQINKKFSENVNGYGLTIKDWADNVRLETLLYGFTVHFVVSSADQPPDMQSAIEQGKTARVISVSPKQIYHYSLKERGVLEFISYQSGETEGVPEYTVWDNGEFYTSSSGDVSKSREGLIEGKGSTKVPPIVFTFEPYYDPWEMPISRFKNLSELAVSLYDEESKVKYQSGATTFSLLLLPDPSFKEGDNLKINENTAMRYNPSVSNGKSPEYITPDNTIEEIMLIVDSVRKEMYETTNMNVLLTGADASGESRAYSDIIRISSLQSISLKCQEFEIKILEAINTTNGVSEKFTINYPTDFASLVISDKIATGQDLINTGIAPANAQLVRVDLMEQYFMGATKEEKEQYELNEQANTEYSEELFKQELEKETSLDSGAGDEGKVQTELELD